MAEPKEIPPIELSAKFMAWDIKGINKSLERLAEQFDKLVNYMVNGSSLSPSGIPF